MPSMEFHPRGVFSYNGVVMNQVNKSIEKVFCDRSLNSSQKLLLLCVNTFEYDEINSKNIKEIISQTGMSRSTIFRCLAGLREKGFLKKEAIVGVIYLVKMRDTKYHKVGITSTNIENRLSGLQVGCPIKIDLVISINSKDCLCCEKKIHDALSNSHVRGEWFEGETKDVLSVVRSFEE